MKPIKVKAQLPLEEYLQKLTLQDGDLLILKLDAPFTFDSLVNTVRSAFNGQPPRVGAIFVRDFDDISLLTDEQLAGFGLCRVKTIEVAS